MTSKRREDCAWPFHCTPGCATCAEWDALYEKNLDDYLAGKATIRKKGKGDG